MKTTIATTCSYCGYDLETWETGQYCFVCASRFNEVRTTTGQIVSCEDEVAA